MWRILYIAQLAGVKLGDMEGRKPRLPFFKIKKSALFFKKDPNCIHPYIKFTIQ